MYAGSIWLCLLASALVTAGRSIGCILGAHQHFCCRCLVLNPWPALEISLKLHGAWFFGFFVNLQNRLIWSVFVFCLFCKCFFVVAVLVVELKIHVFAESNYCVRIIRVNLVRVCVFLLISQEIVVLYYIVITGLRKHSIIEHTHTSLTSLKS